LNLVGWTVVIVGGGAVAARKARGVMDAGAGRVICVAPSICDQMPEGVERLVESYRPAHLDGAAIVFVATDRADVNDAVVRDAHARNLLVNRADVDEDEPVDFIVPAIHRSGELVLAISAASPALAAMIRDRLADLLDPRWQAMAAAMQELRPMIKAAGIDITQRKQIFQELAGQEALNTLGSAGIAGLRNWLLDRHPELNHA
jgi:precorrin-2 dehydrogenase/sirohydrochlorin ferrochelatase